MLLKVPSTFSGYLKGKTETEIDAKKIAEVERAIKEKYGELHSKIYTQDGEVKKHIRLFADGAIITSAMSNEMEVMELVVVSAVSGG